MFAFPLLLKSNNLMTSECISQQLKQKILNYQIKTIQQCPDSLFTDDSCEHERYLTWQLGQQLKHLLKNYHHTYRWIGNDQKAYIYAYFYVLVIGCASQPNLMMKLKIVLYELGQKYLAQYEQKLIIEFLCLIQYSQDRYTFFRKYSKIEGILYKIFKQIQARNPRPSKEAKEASNQNQDFSKMTTCVTSPSHTQPEGKSSILRNSDYYNSSMKRIEKEYKKAMAQKNRKSCNKNKNNCYEWYEIYNKYFYFLKMTQENEKCMKFKIIIKCQTKEEYMITVQKECFFVIQMTEIQKEREIGTEQKNNLRKCSNFEESQLYLKQLIHKQFLQNKILSPKESHQKKNSCKRSQGENSSATPKFITHKKSIKIDNSSHFYKDSREDDVKSVQVEVLEISQFDESKHEHKEQIEEKGQIKQIEYKNKIDSLDNIGETTKTIHHHENKNSIVQQIRSHPLFAQFVNLQQKRRPSQGDISHADIQIARLHQNMNSEQSKCSIQIHQRQKATEIITITPIVPIAIQMFKNNQLHLNNQTSFDKISIQQSNPELNGFYPGRVTEIPDNETMLSAKMIRKNYKNGHGLRDTLMAKPRNEVQNRPFHSNSPPGHLQQKRNRYFSPTNTTITDQSRRPVTRYIPKQIKFTYL